MLTVRTAVVEATEVIEMEDPDGALPVPSVVNVTPVVVMNV